MIIGAVVRVGQRVDCADGTVKLRLVLDDERAVEMVILPAERRTTLCLSSQVGCVRACRFCATGRMGLVRNLTAREIVDQAELGRALAEAAALPEVSNLVFMGMGEPLDNRRAVLDALETLTDPRGLSFAPRRITVSTVGPSVRAVEVGAEAVDCRLAWSLHAADPDIRARLIPTAKDGPDALAGAFDRVLSRKNKGLFIEMALIAGENDRASDLEALMRLLDRFTIEVRVNLLPMNPIGGGLGPSPPARVERFQAAIREAGYFCMVRRPRGQAESAACGQLVTV